MMTFLRVFSCLAFLGIVKCEVVDMSWKFEENVTAWWPSPLFKQFRLENEFRSDFDAPNGNKIWVEMEEYAASSHGGTHMDAPSHIADVKTPGQWTLDQIPADRLMGPLRVVNIVDKAAQNSDYQATVTDITDHERKHGRIPRGAIVLINSGWSLKLPNKTAYWGAGYEQEKLSFPGWSKEAAEYLTTMRGIYGAGVDTPSLDYGKSPDFPTHRAFFSKNVFGLENVARVHEVPESGATLFAFPMKMAGASGGPCRVIAIWGDEKAAISASVKTQFSILLVLTMLLANRCSE